MKVAWLHRTPALLYSLSVTIFSFCPPASLHPLSLSVHLSHPIKNMSDLRTGKNQEQKGAFETFEPGQILLMILLQKTFSIN